jgi:SNF2-related domain/Helicase conserved C-terminal domain
VRLSHSWLQSRPLLSASLHHRRREAPARQHFHTSCVVIDSQETFLRLSTISPTGRRELPPGFYLTTYIDLARNGIAQFPELNLSDPALMLAQLNLNASHVEEYLQHRQDWASKQYELLQVSADCSLAELDAHYSELRRDNLNELYRADLDAAYALLKILAPSLNRNLNRNLHLSDLSPAQRRALTARFAAHMHKEFSGNIGEYRHYHKINRTIHCVYCPSLADLCQDTFAAVICDEGTKIKGEFTIMGQGTRQMRPRFRLPMTGTPIKNRLPDIFHLAHWCTGSHQDPTPRFPFGVADAEAFADEFMVTERNLSKEAVSDTGRRYIKKTPQICNIHKLWKLLSPIVLRRLKTECGEDLVAMHRHIVRVPMGQAQAAVYKYHMEADYRDRNNRPAPGAKLQALRIAAANPCSTLLQAKPHKLLRTNTGSPRSFKHYIPKLASALTIISQILEAREQVVVFSAFHDSLDVLSARLHESGVRHITLDGRTNPLKRGPLAAQFKLGPPNALTLHAPRSLLPAPIPVMLAGVECMSEGHSFNLCSNVILLAYSWAMDKLLQAINRIWRLNSLKDVHVWGILCDGTTDRILEGNIHEKTDASELVLDGHLLGDNPSEINLAELLQIAEKELAAMAADGLVDERILEQDWPALRSQLALAARRWHCPDNVLELPVEPLILPAAGARLEVPGFADLPLWRQMLNPLRVAYPLPRNQRQACKG